MHYLVIYPVKEIYRIFGGIAYVFAASVVSFAGGDADYTKEIEKNDGTNIRAERNAAKQFTTTR